MSSSSTSERSKLSVRFRLALPILGDKVAICLCVSKTFSRLNLGFKYDGCFSFFELFSTGDMSEALRECFVGFGTFLGVGVDLARGCGDMLCIFGLFGDTFGLLTEPFGAECFWPFGQIVDED